MSRLLIALFVLALPVLGRADDHEWNDEDGRWAAPPPADYDVSVDLNVQGAVSFDTFQGSLSPYGDWVVAGSYGRVWRPRVVAGWRPYYYGRWEWTNEGWFWASEEPWGWATYHYGRWAWDSYNGWIWVPGYEWAPAWVSWRYSGDVVGWAPLAPGFSVYVSSYPFVDFSWTFVPCNRFVAVPVYSAAYAPTYTRRFFYGTAPAPAQPIRPGMVRAGPAPAWGGPAPRVIEARIGRPLAPARLVPAPSPGYRGRPGEIAVYRPGPARGGYAAPSRPFPGSEARPMPAPGPSRGDARPVPAPAPGPSRGEARPMPAPGRGPGPAPSPGGHGEAGGGWRPAPGGGAPGWGGQGHGGGRQAAPARPGGHGRGERDHR